MKNWTPTQWYEHARSCLQAAGCITNAKRIETVAAWLKAAHAIGTQEQKEQITQCDPITEST